MKEYSYFIPGYTGFCPELRDHYGETYGYATRHIIQQKPHLKERLAPVQYRYRRHEKTNGKLGKYLGKERDNKYDSTKSKHRTNHLDASEAKNRTDRTVGDARKEFHHLDYADGDTHRGKCYESVYQPTLKHASTSTRDDKILKTDHEYPCPKYIFIQGFAECLQPEMRASGDRRKLPHKYYPCIAIPCAHVREHCISPKKYPMPKPNFCMEEYHPTDCGHKKDANMGADSKMRKGNRVKPHRQGGVIPKYTGHVPGMQFSFGESYGPISDRLLQKHHNRMKEIKIIS